MNVPYNIQIFLQKQLILPFPVIKLPYSNFAKFLDNFTDFFGSFINFGTTVRYRGRARLLQTHCTHSRLPEDTEAVVVVQSAC